MVGKPCFPGKRRKKKVKRYKGPEVFGPELASLAQWEQLEKPLRAKLERDVLATLFGNEADGQAWRQDVRRVMDRAHVSTGEIRPDAVRRSPEVGVRMLGWFVRMLGSLKRRGAQIRATGPEVFQGHHYEPTRTRKVRAPSFAEDVLAELDGAELELDGGELVVRKRSRRYCKMVRAGGIAARVRRSPRTLYRYAVAWSVGGLLDSEQPKHDAEDAVRPRVGDWAYKIWWPVRALPRHTLRRLREAWGESIGTPRASHEPLAPSSDGNPSSASPPSSGPRSTAGPPEDTPEQRAQAVAELAASLKAARDGR